MGVPALALCTHVSAAVRQVLIAPISIMATLAEQERISISERTKAGLVSRTKSRAGAGAQNWAIGHDQGSTSPARRKWAENNCGTAGLFGEYVAGQVREIGLREVSREETLKPPAFILGCTTTSFRAFLSGFQRFKQTHENHVGSWVGRCSLSASSSIVAQASREA
jgi:hypothetical protein